jgi:predicted ATP-dependent endonuclease of OLD family
MAKIAKKYEKNIQFIISTHSPFIVNSALEQDNQKVYHIEDGQCISSLDKKSLKIMDKTTSLYPIYDSLGMKPSDLLFSNCLIWVEGPADSIYIDFWLQSYMKSKELKFVRGVNYEFAIFGGASVENYENDKIKDRTIVKNLNFAGVHPKSFIIVDNDLSQNTFEKQKNWNKENYPDIKIGEILKVKKDKPFITYQPDKGKDLDKNGNKISPKAASYPRKIIVGDASGFMNFKLKLISGEVEVAKKDNFFYEDNTDFRTIESYRVDGERTSGKVERSVNYINSLNIKKNIKFKDVIKPEGRKMVEKIYNFIKVNN